jgi:hypothetical protein
LNHVIARGIEKRNIFRDDYAFGVHSTLMSRAKRYWQELNEVLGRFAAQYRQLVEHQGAAESQDFLQK